MTPLRRHAVLRRVKDITLSATLTLALVNGTVSLQSCRTSQLPEDQRTEEAFRQGVRTYIDEVRPGTFRITDEVPTSADSSAAVVSYYDGHRDTLNVDAARQFVQSDSTAFVNNPAFANPPPADDAYGVYPYDNSGLGNVLLWSRLGYLFGNNYWPYYTVYRQRYGLRCYQHRRLFVHPGRFQHPSGGGFSPVGHSRTTGSSWVGRSSGSARVGRTYGPSHSHSGFFGAGHTGGFSG